MGPSGDAGSIASYCPSDCSSGGIDPIFHPSSQYSAFPLFSMMSHDDPWDSDYEDKEVEQKLKKEK